MRQFLAILLSIFYLVLSTGAAINMHYCGGELDSVQINSNPVSCCCGNMEMSNNCCQDEEFILDLDLDQQIASYPNIVPENLLARRFRDLLGLANQMLAEKADEVIFMQSGIPMGIKGKMHRK